MIHPRYIYIVFMMTFFIACSTVSDSDGTDRLSSDWLIPEGAVFDGGPGKDGIPALSNPEKIQIGQVNYLNPDDLVLLFRHESQVYVYPHRILDWHEIINDDLNGLRLTVSYCPLTGSAVGLEGRLQVDGAKEATTFGVSGLLFNSNLILYDRLTDSYWSQMLNQCVSGRLMGQVPENYQLIETTFATARSMYPDALVVSTQTGIYGSKQYDIYPYGDYRTNDERLVFPVAPDDRRLNRKERVLGVPGEMENRVYRFASFADSVSLVTDQLDDEPIVAAGSRSDNFMVVFKLPAEQGNRTYSAVQDALPNIMRDTDGNIYDIFGRVVEGPDAGMHLEPLHSFIAFWFAWGAFYPGIEITE